MMRSQSNRHAAGFSFIELLASAAILGLLATVAVPLAETTMRRQKEHDLRVALHDIRQGIDAYKQAAAIASIAVLPEKSGYPPSLTELVGGVDDITHPGKKLYFLRRVPRDPFFADMSVPAIETWGKRSYASPPDSPQFTEGTDELFDVYSMSNQTGLNGVAYSEW